MSINLKISIGFTIQNITGFEWHELQGYAQSMADNYASHTVPTHFFVDGAFHFQHQETHIVGFVRQYDNGLEFLFIQPALFDLKEKVTP